MLTQKLEDLIWKGEAKYKTWTIGTGSASLGVAHNKTVIILGFDYFPFIDSQVDDFGTEKDWLMRLNKEIIISDIDNRYSFLARSFYQKDAGARAGAHFFKCYLPFINNVNLSIAHIPIVENWTFTNTKAPAKSNVKKAPLAYGTVNTKSVNTITSLRLGNLLNSEVRPFKATPSATGISFTQFKTPIDIDNVVLNPSISDKQGGQVQFPMITVHYVEINKRLIDTFI